MKIFKFDNSQGNNKFWSNRRVSDSISVIILSAIQNGESDGNV